MTIDGDWTSNRKIRSFRVLRILRVWFWTWRIELFWIFRVFRGRILWPGRPDWPDRNHRIDWPDGSHADRADGRPWNDRPDGRRYRTNGRGRHCYRTDWLDRRIQHNNRANGCYPDRTNWCCHHWSNWSDWTYWTNRCYTDRSNWSNQSNNRSNRDNRNSRCRW